MKKYDVIVVGLGAMGSAALYQLSKRGKKVLGLDQFSPPHTFGSSHGETRLVRQAIGEGELYTPLSLRSYEIWQEIEKETNTNILSKTGGIIISSKETKARNHVPGFVQNTINAAKAYGIRHEVLDSQQIRSKFSQFKVLPNEYGYYEYDMGYVDPELSIKTHMLLAEKAGADIQTNEKVTALIEHSGEVVLTTSNGEYRADRVVMSVGPWLPEYLGDQQKSYFKIYRQVLYWFEVDTVSNYTAPNFPVFISEVMKPDVPFYGFPIAGSIKNGIKVATEQHEVTTTAATVTRNVSEEETCKMYDDYIAQYMVGVKKKCLNSTTCMYTVTPDAGFIIDSHPEYHSVMVVSACSGHGFKHSPAIGEAVAQLITDGKSTIDISRLTFPRE